MGEHIPHEVDAEVRHTVTAQVAAARTHLDATVGRRRAALARLQASPDPDDQRVARVYLDFLRQADEVRRSGAALALAAGPTGRPVVGRMVVLDDARDVALVSWHSPAGQAQLLADDRLLIGEHADGGMALHTLQADDAALAGRIRAHMRVSAAHERMSDPLATLTVEQASVLRTLAATERTVVLHGPPGSGKSAIVMVELARRVLSDPTPGHLRALFVTGTARLARRAEALGRLLGTASIEPVPQADLLAFLGVASAATPQADDDGADGSLRLPQAIEATYDELAARLHTDVEIPHPLGTVPAAEVAAVRRWRAQSASTGYRRLARRLAADLQAEYTAILPGERGQRAARDAAAVLRPDVTPAQLVTTALDGHRIDRALRSAAVAGATDLLTRPGGRPERRYDLVVVDEYQRLPGVAVWLLERLSTRLILSGDPWQSFASAGAPDVPAVALHTSLRLPEAIGRWVDRRWEASGLAPPRVRCAVPGGRVTEIDVDAIPPGTPVIAPASRTARHDGWLTPPEAVGLEWPEVVLVAPDAILAEHGPAGLFIAATRAIDTLCLVA